MVTMENYQVLLCLREMAAIACSKQIWRGPIGRRLITETYHRQKFENWHSEDKLIKLCDSLISMEMVGNYAKLVLPEELKRQLHSVMNFMGCRISKWYNQRDRKKSKVPWLKFCNEHMCWTSHGFINTPETFRSTYNARKIPASYKSWIILCNSCVEDCITDLWGKAKRIISKKMEEYDFDEAKKSDILIFYWFYKKNNDYENFSSFIECLPQNQNIYDAEESPEHNMFIFSVVMCNYEAVKYFFDVLNEDQKQNVMIKLCSFPQYCEPLLSSYKCPQKKVNDEYTQLIMFLLRQFSNYEMHDASTTLLKKSNAVRRLVHWPWHDLFLRIIEEPERYPGAINWDSILKEMLTSMCKKNPNTHDLSCRMIFNEMWESNPGNFKQSIDKTALVVSLSWERDMAMLKTVLDDEALREKREDILEILFNILLILSKIEMDVVDRFMEEVLVCEEERDLLRLKIADHEKNPFFLFRSWSGLPQI